MNPEFFRGETEGLIKFLANYLGTMESHLNITQAEQQGILENWIRTQDPEGLMGDSEYEEFHWVYEYMFPRSLRFSFLVLLFLVLETQLSALCDEVGKRRNLALRVSDLKGDFISRCKTYLEKVASVQPINRNHWQEINDLSKIRNCIVHTLGKVEQSQDRTRIRDIVKKEEGLSISTETFPEKGVIILSSKYCAQAVIATDKFFQELFNSAGFGSALFKY